MNSLKGLIRNNYYTIESTFIAIIAVFVFALIGGVFNNTILLEKNLGMEGISCGIISSMAFMGSFSSLAITLLQNGALSKWDKFELTTPISKADVIKARYITFGVLTLVGLIGSAILLILNFGLEGIFNASVDPQKLDVAIERTGYVMAFSICFLLNITSFTHVLVLKLGADKITIIYMIAVILSFAYFLVPQLMFSDVVASWENPNLKFRLILVTISIIIFIASYFISKKIYTNQDL